MTECRIEIRVPIMTGMVWSPLSWATLGLTLGPEAWTEVWAEPLPHWFLSRAHACDVLSQWRTTYDPESALKARIMPKDSPVHQMFEGS